jgi:hypothetical protein
MAELLVVDRILKLNEFTSKMALLTGELSAKLKKTIVYGPQSTGVTFVINELDCVVNS